MNGGIGGRNVLRVGEGRLKVSKHQAISGCYAGGGHPSNGLVQPCGFCPRRSQRVTSVDDFGEHDGDSSVVRGFESINFNQDLLDLFCDLIGLSALSDVIGANVKQHDFGGMRFQPVEYMVPYVGGCLAGPALMFGVGDTARALATDEMNGVAGSVWKRGPR